VQNLVQTITTTNSHSVISGLGGIGKSSLALNVLHDPIVEAHFSRRVFFRCDNIISTSDLILQLVRLRTDNLSDCENPSNALREELRVKTTLLLLDNFETLWEADRRAVEELLQHIADIESLTLIITTRPGAFVHHLSCRRRFERLLLPGIDPQSAREFFLHVAPLHSHDEDLDQLLKPMDGYPLVIKLVAARAAEEQTIRDVIKLWEKETIAFADDDWLEDRQRSLKVSLSLSINSPLIGRHPNALDLLALLAQSPTGFYVVPLQNSKAVQSDAERVLLDMSLAFREKGEMGLRLRLLVPVAEFVRTTLEPPSFSIVNSVTSFYFAELATIVDGKWYRNDRGLHLRYSEDMPSVFTLIRKCLKRQPYVALVENFSRGLRFTAMALRSHRLMLIHLLDEVAIKAFFEEVSK
jgi:hypothetical protein